MTSGILEIIIRAETPELAYRDRIVVTIGELAEMKVWMGRGMESGITLNELRGLRAIERFEAYGKQAKV